MCSEKIQKSIVKKSLEVWWKNSIMYYIYFIYKKHIMQTKYVKPIIDILWKRKNKIISDNQIKQLQESILSEPLNTSQFYKLIFMLKKRKYLISLRKDLYKISSPSEHISKEKDITEEYYRSLLYERIKSVGLSKYYIGSTKWIEMHLHNYDAISDIIIYNEKLSKKEVVILDHNVFFKTCSTTPYKRGWLPPIWSSKDVLTKIGIKNSSLMNIEKYYFSVWPIELCILESLYYEANHDTTYLYDLIKRAIKKYKHTRDRWLLKNVISLWKYHTSINRLAQLMKTVDQWFFQQCLNIIDQVWFRIGLKSKL